MVSLSIDSISLATFNTILSRYASTVPSKIKKLDAHRYTSIPTAVEHRKAHGTSIYLQRPEVRTLIEWKLRHGTFRPKLLELVMSNSDFAIESTTAKAFQLLDSQYMQGDAKDILPAVKLLATLKGIGPATASLLLSVYAPADVPFFSDEMFRWVMWNEPEKRAGWKRVVQYSLKEYKKIVDMVGGLRGRLGVGAVDVEKVAWVLGKEGVDVGGGVDDGAEGGETEVNLRKEEDEVKEKEKAKAETKEEKNLEQDSKSSKGKKREAEDTEVPAQGVRRSTRIKTAG